MKRTAILFLTIALAIIGLPSTDINCDAPRSTNSAYASNLTELVVSSYGGYGLYLRSSPRDGAKTKTIYRDGTRFYGYYSNTSGWVSVVKSGRVIGYLPAEKVVPVNDYYDYYPSYSSGLTEYVVSSDGGYGLYLRSSPRDGAKTKTVYRDGTHFLGYYSGTPGWISVVVNNRVIGYLPAEKVYEAY